MIKRMIPFLLLPAPYLLIAALYSPAFAAWFVRITGGLWLEIAVALAIAIWAASLYAVQTGYWSEMVCTRWNLALKLVHFPFYTALLLVMLASPQYLFVLFWPLAMTVTASGLYAVRAISLAQKRGAVSKYFVLVHLIICYIPLLDCLSALAVYYKLSKCQPAETKR